MSATRTAKPVSVASKRRHCVANGGEKRSSSKACTIAERSENERKER
jgi:hypothetical protein